MKTFVKEALVASIGAMSLISSSFAQTLCIHVDSISIIYVPMNLTTGFALDEYDVKSFDSPYRSKQIIRDSVSLGAFLIAEPLEHLKCDNGAIDVRMIIEVFSAHTRVMKVLVHKSWIFLKDEEFYRSIRLEQWVRNLELNNLTVTSFQTLQGEH